MEHCSALVQRVFGKVVCEQVPDQLPMNRSTGQALGTVLGVAVVGGAVLAGAVLTDAVLTGAVLTGAVVAGAEVIFRAVQV